MKPQGHRRKLENMIPTNPKASKGKYNKPDVYYYLKYMGL